MSTNYWNSAHKRSPTAHLRLVEKVDEPAGDLENTRRDRVAAMLLLGEASPAAVREALEALRRHQRPQLAPPPTDAAGQLSLPLARPPGR